MRPPAAPHRQAPPPAAAPYHYTAVWGFPQSGKPAGQILKELKSLAKSASRGGAQGADMPLSKGEWAARSGPQPERPLSSSRQAAARSALPAAGISRKTEPCRAALVVCRSAASYWRQCAHAPPPVEDGLDWASGEGCDWREVQCRGRVLRMSRPPRAAAAG